MRAIGWVLLGIGGAWLVASLMMDTSVAVPGGYGWSNRVQNLGLMEARRTHLMLSVSTIVVGILLIGFSSLRGAEQEESDYFPCPLCAEPVRLEAVICRHCRNKLPTEESDETCDPDVAIDGVEEPEDGEATYSYRELREAAQAAEQGIRRGQDTA